MKIGIGILVFNPFDDEYHLERIQTCINSIIEAKDNYIYNDEISIYVLENLSSPIGLKVDGVGPITRNWLDNNKSILKHEIVYTNSMMVKGYNELLKIEYNDNCDYISVFADDYIMPNDWFNIILQKFKDNIKFVMSSTTFVAQKNLLIPFRIRKKWELNRRNNLIMGVNRFVTIEDINIISKKIRFLNDIKYIESPSFESTLFHRSIMNEIGFLDTNYYSLFFNFDYFRRITKHFGNVGIISGNSFVFHYGKGGTKALYKKEGDEKHKDSPVESYLISDVERYNKQYGSNVDYFWRNPNISKNKNSYFYGWYNIIKFNLIDLIRKSEFLTLKLKKYVKKK